MKYPLTALMVSPEAFDIRYSINVHMTDETGHLKVVDKKQAQDQWTILKSTYEKIGCSIKVVSGEHDYPDMVFCANQSFPFLDQDGLKCVLMSHMHAEQRKGEVPLIKDVFKNLGYKIYELTHSGDLEGSGDLLCDFESGRVFAGFGFRTSIDILNEVDKVITKECIKLELLNPRFYHLDTCLSIFNSKCAGFVREAFSPEGIKTLIQSFPDLIELNPQESLAKLAGNAHCPDGKNVIIQKDCIQTVKELKLRGFIVHEVDTSEYLKSGGSVFCLKQMIF